MRQSNMKTVTIVLDAAHGINVAGKGSPAALFPDRFPNQEAYAIREYERGRVMCRMMKELLCPLNYNVYETNTKDAEYTYKNGKPNLNKHVEVANSLPGRYKLLQSLHINAVGMGDEWKKTSLDYAVFTWPGFSPSDIMAEYDIQEVKKAFPEFNVYSEVSGKLSVERKFTVLSGNYWATLSELLFQDVLEHAKLLKDDNFLYKYCQAKVAAIERFEEYVNKNIKK